MKSMIRVFLIALVALLLPAIPALAGTGHFYIPAAGMRGSTTNPCTANTLSTSGTRVWDCTNTSGTGQGVEAEVWFPESSTSGTFVLVPVFRVNSTDTTKNVCYEARYAVALNGGVWDFDPDNCSGSQIIANGTSAVTTSANTDIQQTISTLVAYQTCAGSSGCTANICKNAHGRLQIRRRSTTNCTNDIGVTQTPQLEGADFQITTL